MWVALRVKWSRRNAFFFLLHRGIHSAVRRRFRLMACPGRQICERIKSIIIPSKVYAINAFVAKTRQRRLSCETGVKQAREGRETPEGAASESYQGGDWTNDTVSKFPRSVEWRKRASPSKSVRQLILQGRKRKQKVNSPACIPGPSSRRWVLYLR